MKGRKTRGEEIHTKIRYRRQATRPIRKRKRGNNGDKEKARGREVGRNRIIE